MLRRRICKNYATSGIIKKEEGPGELRKPGFLRYYKKPENIFLLDLVGRLSLLSLVFFKIKRIGFPSGNCKKHVMTKAKHQPILTFSF